MKTEVTGEFDFRRKEEQQIEVEKNPKISILIKKRLKFAAFLIVGGIAIGVSLGITNNLMKGYLINKQAESNAFEIQTKNEELRKNKEHEINLKENARLNELKNKQLKINEAEQEKLSIEQDKEEYNVLLKNKDDMIKNYQSQLGIYDKAYKEAVQGVKDGLLSLEQLTEIRDNYQQYKKNINGFVKFINDTTVSFNIFHNLDEDSRKSIDEELEDYQSGSINRNMELENALLKIGDDSNDDEEDTKLETLRTNAKNNMIDDISDIIKNDNVTTVTKKLKR